MSNTKNPKAEVDHISDFTSLLQPKMTPVNVTHYCPPLYPTQRTLIVFKHTIYSIYILKIKLNGQQLALLPQFRGGCWDDFWFNPQCGQNPGTGSCPCNTFNIELRYPWARYSAGHSFTAVPWLQPHLTGDRKNSSKINIFDFCGFPGWIN